MRITQGMLSNNMLNNLSNNYSKLGMLMDQLHTGKKITRPSDDPVVAMKGINYRTQLSEVEQYTRNLGEVHNWMDNSDAALDKATQALQRLRELAVDASTDTNGESERENIKKEAEQLKKHLIEIANTKVNDKYIFNGTNTTEKPFNENGEWVGGDYNNMNRVLIQVSSGTNLESNVDPKSIFGELDEAYNIPELFRTVESLIDSLNNDDREGIENSISKLDDSIDLVINARADLGARMNRLDLIENRLGEQEVIVKKMMSDNENIDYEKAITEFITQETVLRASLSAGSRVIQPSLVDFLR